MPFLAGRNAALFRSEPAARGPDRSSDPVGSAVRLGLKVVLAFAPLAFGAVHSWAYGIVWSVLWILVGLWGLRTWRCWAKSSGAVNLGWIRLPFQPLMVFFGLWVILQLLPLPVPWIGRIQPETLEAHWRAVPLLGDLPDFLQLSLYPHATRVGLFHLWSYAAVFYLTLYHLRSRAHILRMAVLWVLVGTFEALYGLLEYLGGTHRIWWWVKPFASGVTGTFINRDHLAGFLEMTLLVAIGLLLGLRAQLDLRRGISWRARVALLGRDERLAKALLLGFLCVLMGAALFLSLSRGGVISLTAVILPISVALLFRPPTRRYGLLGLAVFGGMVLYSLPLGLEGLVGRFSSMERDLGVRRELWRGTQQLALAYPLAGSGWGTFEWVYPRFKPTRFGEMIVPHAHNDWAELLGETGAVGLAAVLAGVGIYLAVGLVKWRRRRSPWGIWLGFSVLAIVVVLGAHGFGEFLLHTQANALTLSAILAWGWVVLHHHRRGEGEHLDWSRRSIHVPRLWGHLLMLFLSCLHLLIGMGMARHLIAEWHAPTERNSTIPRPEIHDVLPLVRAVELEPANALRWMLLSGEVLERGISWETIQWARERGIGTVQGGGDSVGWALAFLKEALRRNPTNPECYDRMAWLLANLPGPRKVGLAEYALREAVRLEPKNGARHFRLGHLLLLEGRVEEARAAFREAVRLSPRLKQALKSEWRLLGKGAPPI